MSSEWTKRRDYKLKRKNGHKTYLITVFFSLCNNFLFICLYLLLGGLRLGLSSQLCPLSSEQCRALPYDRPSINKKCPPVWKCRAMYFIIIMKLFTWEMALNILSASSKTHLQNSHRLWMRLNQSKLRKIKSTIN